MAYYLRRSVLTLIWLVVAMLLLVSLISYSANDPSWSHLSSHTDEVSNLAGKGGAWLADMLYTFLGASSWWLIIIACYEAWRVWCLKTQPIGALRTLGYIFLIIATAALTGLISVGWLAQGIIGQVVGLGLSNLLTSIGAMVFLLIFLLITLAFTFNLQPQRLFGKNEKSITNDNHETEKTPVQETETKEEPAAIAKVLPTTQQLALPLDNEYSNDDVLQQTHSSRLNDFLDETGFSEAKDYEWMETDPNAANNPFKPISSIHLANKKLTKKLDSLLKREVIRSPKDKNNQPSAKPLHQTPESNSPAIEEITINTPHFVNEVATEGSTDTDDTHDIIAQEPTSNKVIATTDIENEQSQPVSYAHGGTKLPSFGMNFATVKLHVKKPKLANQPSIDEQQENQVAYKDNNNPPTTSVAPVKSSMTELDSETSFFTLNAEDEETQNHEHQLYDTNFAVSDVAETVVAEPEMSVAEILGMRKTTQLPQDNEHETEQEITIPVATHERSVEIDELKPVTPTPLDIHDDAQFAGKSRAMQTAAYRASLSPLPSYELLDLPDPDRSPSYSREQLQQLSELLEIKLQEFNVKANVVNAQLGPVVTRFEVELAPGVKASKVTGIAKDLARSLSMASVRVVEVIPGKPYIGIEVPNPQRQMVRLIELLQTEAFQDPNGLISMAMGKDIAGRPVIADLAKAPHMLVAGTTGSGKSVLVNSLLLSMLLKYTPEQLRLILIDPKQLELANYNDIPHLLTPVVTDMTEAASALSWCVAEMERRYQLMSLFKVRKLDEFNKKVIASNEQGHPLLDPLWRVHDSVSQDKPPVLKPLPQIVIVADEFADMMMQVGKQAEELITRLAQKSRAAGIHLILATQRPSVDVITGLIKANIPVRAALRVNSKVDSRTILDAGGAEDMLGHGDMLFLAPGQNEPNRVHGAFISDAEVNRICDAWRERGAPDYIDNMFDNFALTSPSSGGGESSGIATGDEDALYDEVVAFVLETRKVSASSIQRKFSIGYNRAARIVDAMEEAGLVSAMGKSGKRELLV